MTNDPVSAGSTGSAGSAASPASATGRRGRRGRRWTEAAIPPMDGRTAVITGANSGVGLATATTLAAHGATVLLACRDQVKADQAADTIVRQTGADRACVRAVRLDLASLDSVRAAAEVLLSVSARLDLLINNAAVMRPPSRRSADGFELTFATNHLGHFALTGLLLDRLMATDGSRVVTVSSLGHRDGVMHFDDLHFDAGYLADDAYAQSKLANLLFTNELQARLEAAGASTIALAAHPGLARTGLWRWDPLPVRVLASAALAPFTFWLAQSASRAALPVLRAAADPSARGGDYFGPGGWNEYTGHPVLVESSERAKDVQARQSLWEVSERLTGVAYRLPRITSPRP